jgi:hypothetical protein
MMVLAWWIPKSSMNRTVEGENRFGEWFGRHICVQLDAKGVLYAMLVQSSSVQALGCKVQL